MKLNFRNVDATRGSLSHGVTPLLIPSTTNGSVHPNQVASSQNRGAVNVATSGAGSQPNQSFHGPMPPPPRRRCRSSLGTWILYLFGVLVILTLPIALPVAVSHAVRIVDWPGGIPGFANSTSSFPSQTRYHRANTSFQNPAQERNGLVPLKPVPVSAPNAFLDEQPQVPAPRIPPKDPATIQSPRAVTSFTVQSTPHQKTQPSLALNSFPSVMAHPNEDASTSASGVMGPAGMAPQLQGSQLRIEKSLNHASDVARTTEHMPPRPLASPKQSGKSLRDGFESVGPENVASNVAAYRHLQNGVFLNEDPRVDESGFVRSKSLDGQYEKKMSMKPVSGADETESVISYPRSREEHQGRQAEYAHYSSGTGGVDLAQSNWMVAAKEGRNDTSVQGQMIDYSGNLGNMEAALLDKNEWRDKRMEAGAGGRSDGVVDEWHKYAMVRHGNLYLSETFEARLNEQVARRIYEKHPEIFGRQVQEGNCGGKEEVSFSFKASPRIRAELEIVTRCGHGGSSCTIKSEVDDLRRLHVNVGPGNGGEHFLRADGGAGSGGVWWGPLEGPLKVRLKESSMVVLRRVCGAERRFVWRVLSVGQIKQILREIEEVERGGGKGESGLFDVFRYDAHPHEHIDRAMGKGL